jgi:hypothetical protein
MFIFALRMLKKRESSGLIFKRNLLAFKAMTAPDSKKFPVWKTAKQSFFTATNRHTVSNMYALGDKRSKPNKWSL